MGELFFLPDVSNTRFIHALHCFLQVALPMSTPDKPLDTVKVKMQAFPSLYPNWVRCTADTFRLDGIRGLYAGQFTAVLRHLAFFSKFSYNARVGVLQAPCRHSQPT